MRKVAGLLALVLFGSVAWAASQVTQGAAVEEDFSFALVADVQYAAKPDSGLRRYATSIDRLREAVVDWSDEDLDFTVQLGDIIDGADSPEASMGDLNRVLSVFADAPQPLRHVVGNHCLEVTRASLEERLPLSPTWYSFRRGIWRFVVVDSLWMGLPGRSPEE
ncbi:MAG: manganese-dependent ADP-ribose/CDP-alcohol diphosphatase, partial [Planctomycetota bacterium]